MGWILKANRGSAGSYEKYFAEWDDLKHEIEKLQAGGFTDFVYVPWTGSISSIAMHEIQDKYRLIDEQRDNILEKVRAWKNGITN